MAKKEKEPREILRDLFVKLTKVFKKDMYIYQGKFCIAGPETDEEAIGVIVCTLEPKYEAVVKSEIIDNQDSKSPLILLNLSEAKEAIDAGKEVPIREVIFKDTIEECVTKINEVTEMFTVAGMVWKSLSDDPDLIQAIFKEKLIFKMPIDTDDNEFDGDKEYISIASQMLPLVTEENINGAFAHWEMVEKEEDLCKFLINFSFTHFRLQAVYYVVILPFL